MAADLEAVIRTPDRRLWVFVSSTLGELAEERRAVSRAVSALAGAAEGLRRRVGLRVWPTLRQSEEDRVDQVRQTLGAQRFGQAFSAGSGLTQQEA